MASTVPTPPTPSSLFAAIDMGTNSFKMIIARAYPNGKFFTIDHLKEPVVLGRDTSSSTSNFRLSTHSEFRAVEALQRFQRVLESYKISKAQTRCVATAAVREAVNKWEFTEHVRERTGFEVEVLPGEEEARLMYLGLLQFLPIYDKQALGVDIGGGSTEFVIGKQGNVKFGASLKLGHVNLTQRFGNNDEEVPRMREYIRSVIQQSGLVENVKECGFEVASGSSGTIRAIEEAVSYGYSKARDNFDNVKVFGECNREWRLSREELGSAVERLCSGREREKLRKDRFFKRRSEFIVAGAVLLEEIFNALEIEKMEVSGYALAEGVVAETLTKVYDGYDLNANGRWRSVVQLAERFNNKRRMIAAAQCACIAKEIFEDLRRCNELAGNHVAESLGDKDMEYIEAACMLHNIGLFAGKKGFHKESYRIIMNGDSLHGYNTEEVKLIALLARYQRKKLPKFDHASFKEFSEEAKKKFRFLCAILRISVALWQHGSMICQEGENSYSCEGLKLAYRVLKDQNLLPSTVQPLAENSGEGLRQELEHFKMCYMVSVEKKMAGAS
ncbi:hypothetical protein FNV43_RR05025 [Rhamnella rubrinervis]|uniref:Exopolyphosphatase n=1 Tax=Rhamnella rubrinervis TaxID=2594499 RepID=A0A8K0HKP3_9ROSA|nr:hypothetical protein FNV43_RR05025 [Rhamnella rubrinervis]